jgi:hypothetical protein
MTSLSVIDLSDGHDTRADCRNNKHNYSKNGRPAGMSALSVGARCNAGRTRERMRWVYRLRRDMLRQNVIPLVVSTPW